jgi:uncharacterized DUF497 family protein
MRYHETFEWDEEKAELNFRAHRVTFDLAAECLADEQADLLHLEEDDEVNSEYEDRRVTTCSHPENRRVVLCVCWTSRTRSGKDLTRIISARFSTKNERMSYEKFVRRKTDGTKGC